MINTTASVAISFTLTLNECELRALHAIFSYDPEAFLEGCYKYLGRAYIQQYADGLRSLHSNVKGQAAGLIHKADQIRQTLKTINQPVAT